MPLFEYRCSACGRRTEVLVLAGDTAAAPVCGCGSSDLSRLLSTFAAHGTHKAEAGGFDGLPCGEGACDDPGACGMGMNGPCGMDADY